jgi:hypothetical protein
MATQAAVAQAPVDPEAEVAGTSLALAPTAAPEEPPAEAALAPIIVIKKIMPGHAGAHGGGW